MVQSAKQLPLDLTYRPAFGREDFLVSPENQTALSMVDRWPDWSSPALILHGPPSCGKTHLAAVWQSKSKAISIPMDRLDSFDPETVMAQKEAAAFVLDGLDLWIGDRQAETVVFHLYNALNAAQKHMLITLRRPPTQLDFIVPDLASRLRASASAGIDTPGDALLTAILVKLFNDRQIQVSPDMLDYLLPRMDRSFAAARAIVNAVDKLSLSEKRAVTVPLLRRVLLEFQGGQS